MELRELLKRGVKHVGMTPYDTFAGSFYQAVHVNLFNEKAL